MSATDKNVRFVYGQNLTNSNVTIHPGAVYFDTLKKQIWYDNPAGAESHELLTTLTNVEVMSSEDKTSPRTLPNASDYYHNDIIVLKNLISGTDGYSIIPYINVHESEWLPLGGGYDAKQIYISDTTAEALAAGWDTLVFDNEDGGEETTAILGTAKLGFMILGKQ